MVVAQATALSNERTALAILGRRLTASVALIKALGGGWDASPREMCGASRRRLRIYVAPVPRDDSDFFRPGTAPRWTSNAPTRLDSRL